MKALRANSDITKEMLWQNSSRKRERRKLKTSIQSVQVISNKDLDHVSDLSEKK